LNASVDDGHVVSVSLLAVGESWRRLLRLRNNCAFAGMAFLCGIGSTHGQTREEPEPPTVEAAGWDAPEPWRTDRFFLQTSIYTRHFSDDPDHNDQQNLILVEYNINESWLAGVAAFDNSFGQSSQFVYGGYRFRPFDTLQPLYFKVAAGILHGYRGEFRDKIPLNGSGFAPAIVPSVGYCIRRYCSELVLFGGAGLLLTVGVTLP